MAIVLKTDWHNATIVGKSKNMDIADGTAALHHDLAFYKSLCMVGSLLRSRRKLCRGGRYNQK